jgi:hypothetical protein
MFVSDISQRLGFFFTAWYKVADRQATSENTKEGI